LNAETLAQVLRPIENIFKPSDYPDLMIGINAPDDAAVWKLDDENALVISTDFFTPVVDSAYEYGAIAAANSLSDIYAMGAKPFLALNVAALPPSLPTELLSEILRGGAEKAREAGVVIAGGHTIQDQEPKYGLIVLGMVHPDELMSKSGARPGDVLMLSKPLGFGTMTTAIKSQKASFEDINDVTTWMMRLNRDAASLATTFGVQAATDITGFSLLGHAWEMAVASGVGLHFEWDALPFLEGARRYAEDFIFPGGASDNKLYFQPHVRFRRELEEHEELLLFDPQTSGGLLLAVPAEKANAMLAQAQAEEQLLWRIGEVVEGSTIEIA